MIIEGILTTINPDGSLRISPMGPRLLNGFDRFELRPFQTSATLVNLLRSREGVLHVTDDALLFAKTAMGLPAEHETKPANAVVGRILVNSCRYFEFRVVDADTSRERASLQAETVSQGRLRDFLGFNRARHAVIEVAIIATRAEWLPIAEIRNELARGQLIVDKTGGDAEHEAIALLGDFLRRKVEARGETLPTACR